ncbi:MAG: hypothetical protein Q9184_008020, partial [Pyrenodesmia sp. 2 TL-2023]
MESSHANPAWTYRLGGIPAGTTPKQLEEIFHSEDREFIQINSLVPAADNHDLSGEQIATVTFQSPKESDRRPRILHREIWMDDQFEGLTPLYQPQGPIAADVIAVTGLAGHAFGSWAHSRSEMWLRDYLPMDITNVRVMTYGYNSKLQANKARSIFGDHSTSFINRLKEMRISAQCEDRPIVFIGHSLGCLIIKQVKFDANHLHLEYPESDSTFYQALIDFNGSNHLGMHLPVRSIIFFGAPHKGLETSALELLVQSEPSEDLVKELKPGSGTLMALNQRFCHVSHDMRILSLYEKVPTKAPVKMQDGQWKREGKEQLMVTPDSAILYDHNEDPLGCEDDHSQIAKVKRVEGGAWYAIKAAIEKAVHGQASLAATQLSLPTRPAQERIDSSAAVNSHETLDHLAVAAPRSEHSHNSDNDNEDEGPASVLQTELCSAIEAGNVNSVQRLMVEGARVHTSHEEEVDLIQDPFLLAAWCRQERVIQVLLRYGPNPTKCSLDRRHTALHLIFRPKPKGAQRPLTKSLIELLLRSNLVLEARDSAGMTPLLMAAMDANVKQVSYLLDRGADLGAIANNGQGVLHWAARKDRQLKVVEFLIAKGASLELKDENDTRPIAVAAKEGSQAIVECLFDRGANIGATASHEWTPLICSAISGRTETARWLLDHGAKTSEFNDAKKTALHFAAWWGHSEVLDLLISNSLSSTIDHQAYIRETPLHLSATRPERSESCGQCAKLLLQAGAKTEIRDKLGLTALHVAAQYGSVEVAKELLASGADVEAKRIPGNQARPLHQAKYFGHPQVVELLLQALADPFAHD